LAGIPPSGDNRIDGSKTVSQALTVAQDARQPWLVSPSSPAATCDAGHDSSDADDPLFAYQWTFHDSTTVAGISASRVYPQDGVVASQLSSKDLASATSISAKRSEDSRPAHWVNLALSTV
jgi:hypothetical protein